MKPLIKKYYITKSLAVITSCLLIIGWAGQVGASYMQSIYPTNVLAYWKTRYEKNIRLNVDDPILTNLTPVERQAIGRFSLMFPLIAPEQNSPINFYARGNPRSVVIPILSVKFFDDLAIASAWLLFNNRSQETVYNYMGLLKYQAAGSSAGRRYPAPLEALRIPADALNDSRVDSLSQKILKSALVFIICHELGHLRYNHQGYDIPLNEARQNELQADEFAMELMRRIGVPPLGITNYFMAALYLTAHRGDFGSDQEWERYLRERSTHPLSSERLKRLSEKLKRNVGDYARMEPDINNAIAQVNYAAGQLEGIARILDDPKIMGAIAHIGRTTDVASLAPRPEGHLGQQLTEDEEATHRARQVFAGVYKGSFTLGQGPDAVPIGVKLSRNGNRVAGSYAYGLGNGKIAGLVEGNRMYFQWQEGQDYGKGVFRADESGSFFSGTWGYAESSDNGGLWTGKRE